MINNTFRKTLAIALLGLMAAPYAVFATELPPESTPDPIPTETLCADGLDNDADDLTDLADPDCAAFIPVLEVMPTESSSPEIVVVVNVVNNSGGSAVPASATVNVTATNPLPATFPGEATPGTIVSMNLGSYNVTTPGIANYTTSYSEACTKVVVPMLESKVDSDFVAVLLRPVCTITLDDLPVISGGGGSASFGGSSCSGSACGGSVAPTPTPTPTPAPATPKGKVLGDTVDKEINPPAPKACTPFLLDYIKFGRKNNPEEVKKLQTFLNSYINADLEVNGIFDLKTFNAVKAFQVKESGEILSPWSAAGRRISKNGTGYVFKTTKRRINNIMCAGLNLPMPQL